jgi:APA family basic amino acid/polyamine antiporter
MADPSGHGASGSGDLPRVLGLVDVYALLVGSVIGSGIFIVPATIAAAVGAPTLLMAVWIVGGVLSFFGALAFSELAAAYPHAGGMYVYLREAYGRLVAFLFGWALFFVIDSGAIAALAVAFSTKYLPFFVEVSPTVANIVSVALIALLVVVNCASVRWGALVQRALTTLKVVALVVVTVSVLLFADGDASHFVTPPAADWSGPLVAAFGVGLVASLWAYKGWEVVTFTAGEVRDPQRNLPLGLFLGTLTIVVLYLSANVAYLYALPISAIAASSRIAADAMSAAVGPIAASIVAGIILLSITGALNGTILTSPRVFFAMARDGLFFERIADVHPSRQTPYVAILATGLWSAILCFTGSFEQLLAYVIFGQWIFFGLTVAAVFILRRTRRDLPRPYRTWGYPVTPALFVAAALFISVNSLLTQFWNSISGLALILLGVPAFAYWNRGAGGQEKR